MLNKKHQTDQQLTFQLIINLIESRSLSIKFFSTLIVDWNLYRQKKNWNVLLVG